MNPGHSIRRLICNGYLAALLVAAQIAVVSHVDVDGHAVESPCAICASASTLSAAAVASITLSPPPIHAPAPAPQPVRSIHNEPFHAQPARAPPASA